jgi:hypothetical protein
MLDQQYQTDIHTFWRYSTLPPELLAALDDGWLGLPATPSTLTRARHRTRTPRRARRFAHRRRRPLQLSNQPRPISGISVPITVMNCTFAPSGKLAI